MKLCSQSRTESVEHSITFIIFQTIKKKNKIEIQTQDKKEKRIIYLIEISLQELD